MRPFLIVPSFELLGTLPGPACQDPDASDVAMASLLLGVREQDIRGEHERLRRPECPIRVRFATAEDDRVCAFALELSDQTLDKRNRAAPLHPDLAPAI